VSRSHRPAGTRGLVTGEEWLKGTFGRSSIFLSRDAITERTAVSWLRTLRTSPWASLGARGVGGAGYLSRLVSRGRCVVRVRGKGCCSPRGRIKGRGGGLVMVNGLIVVLAGYAVAWVVSLRFGTSAGLAAFVAYLAAGLVWWVWTCTGSRRVVWVVRRGWARLALACGLSVKRLDQEPAKTLYPRPTVRGDVYGVRVDCPILPGQIFDDFQRAAPAIAEQWGCVRVQVTKPRPGRVELRGLITDPLTEPYPLTLSGKSADPRALHLGRDEHGAEVHLSLAGISGLTLGGLAGYGKTSLLAYWLAQLAPNPAAALVVCDGKGGGDYEPYADRLWCYADDDLTSARDVLQRVFELMRTRQSSVRDTLGTTNAWHAGPSPAWPLVLVVVDECHTYCQTTGRRKDDKDAAYECAWLVEQLIRKGRSVMITVIVATQKQTGDSIPTAIRDNCQAALSFAVRTREAAVAALGDGIGEFPDVSPVTLQDRAYIGVAVTSLPGHPGFVRVRVPHINDTDAALIATASAVLAPDPEKKLSQSELANPVDIAA